MRGFPVDADREQGIWTLNAVIYLHGETQLLTGREGGSLVFGAWR